MGGSLDRHSIREAIMDIFRKYGLLTGINRPLLIWTCSKVSVVRRET
jgi:hypothetical protein